MVSPAIYVKGANTNVKWFVKITTPYQNLHYSYSRAYLCCLSCLVRPTGAILWCWLTRLSLDTSCAGKPFPWANMSSQVVVVKARLLTSRYIKFADSAIRGRWSLAVDCFFYGKVSNYRLRKHIERQYIIKATYIFNKCHSLSLAGQPFTRPICT